MKPARLPRTSKEPSSRGAGDKSKSTCFVHSIPEVRKKVSYREIHSKGYRLVIWACNMDSAGSILPRIVGVMSEIYFLCRKSNEKDMGPLTLTHSPLMKFFPAIQRTTSILALSVATTHLYETKRSILDDVKFTDPPFFVKPVGEMARETTESSREPSDTVDHAVTEVRISSHIHRSDHIHCE